MAPIAIAGFFAARHRHRDAAASPAGIRATEPTPGNDAPTFGGGAAVRASGQQNHGLIASASGSQADGMQALRTGNGTAVRARQRRPAWRCTQAVGQTGVTAEATGDSANGANWRRARVRRRDVARASVGTAVSALGIGVKGVAQRVNGATTGVHGEATSPAGVGVRALATSLTGGAEGVRAEVASPDTVPESMPSRPP